MQWPASMKVPTYEVSLADRPTFRFGNGLSQRATSRVDLTTNALGRLSFYIWTARWRTHLLFLVDERWRSAKQLWPTVDPTLLIEILLCSSRSSWHLVGKWSSSSTWSTCGQRCERAASTSSSYDARSTSATSWTRSSRWWWWWRTSWTWWRCTSWWWTWWWLQGDCHQDRGALTVVQVNPKLMKLCDRQRWPNLWSLRAKWRHWLKVKEKEKKRTHRWKKTNLWNLDLLTLNTMHLLLLEFPFSKMPWLES